MNLIVTPLFHYTSAMFFKIFGSSFFTFELLGAMINSSIIIASLSIVKQYTYKKSIWVLSTFMFLFPFVSAPYSNYNYLMLLFPVIILYFEKKYQSESETRNIKIDFIIGILLALMILTKQTIGLIFSFSFFLYYIINLMMKNKAFTLKGVFCFALGVFLPILVFLMYLFVNNIFLDFINYCFGSIFEFGSKNLSSESNASVLFVVLFIIIAVILANSYKKRTINILYVLFCLASLIIAYPLANSFHLLLALFIPSLVFIASICDTIPYLEGNNPEKYKKVGFILSITGVIVLIASYGYKSYGMFEADMPLFFENEFAVFNGNSAIDQETVKKIQKVHNYVEEKRTQGYSVYILSSDAGLYEIPYKEWNIDYDLLLNGNMGYDGTNRVINELSQIQKPLFLKNSLGKCNAQESKEIEEYVTNNYDEVEKIFDFRVFVSRGDTNIENQ